MADNRNQVAIPPELEQLLFDFTVDVLVNNPPNLVSHAVTYFTRLQSQRDNLDTLGEHEKTEIERSVIAGMPVTESITNNLGSRRGRRVSVCGEAYNPDDDSDFDVEVFEKTSLQRKKIKEHIEKIFLFRAMDDQDKEAVIDAMTPRPVKAGEVIIRQGDDGDYCYVIENGSYDTFIKQKNGEEEYVKNYLDSGCFGELALLYNVPRAATIKAKTDGFLWAISRQSFCRLIVKRAHNKRNNYISLLDSVPELKPLSHYEKMVVCDALKPVSFQPKEVIFKQGDEANGMYFIVNGKVAITKETSTGKSQEVVELSDGEYFGELALVKKKPRAATATSTTISKLAFLDLHAFERLLGPCMDILKRHIDTYTDLSENQ